MINPVFLSLKVEAPKLTVELKSVKLPEEELNSLRRLIHKTFFVELLDFCLTELKEDSKKRTFLELIHSPKKRHSQALQFLENHIDNFHFKFKKKSLTIDLELSKIANSSLEN